MRLGVADPRELDDLPQEVWTYWHALAIVDDWDHDGFAALAAHAHNSLMIACRKLGGVASEDDLRTPEHYHRKFKWERKAKPPLAQTADEQFAILKSICGIKHA